MTTKFTLQRIFWTVLIILLVVACGNLTPQSTPTATQAPTLVLTATQAPSLTSINPTPTTVPVTSTSTSLPISSPPDGLRMAYILDGNLYFQDGSNSAIQLTDSGEDWQPMFSDDGEKIVFFRGKDWKKDELHSINRDGSEEQVLVTSQLLMALNNSYTESTRPHY